jgi:hypothetical protein
MASKFIQKLGKLNPFREGGRIDKRFNAEVQEKATIGTRAVLMQLDVDLPKLTALLSGQPVELDYSGTLKLHLREENDEE